MDYLSSLPTPITKKSMYPQINEELMPSGSVSLDSYIKACVKETGIKT